MGKYYKAYEKYYKSLNGKSNIISKSKELFSQNEIYQNRLETTLNSISSKQMSGTGFNIFRSLITTKVSSSFDRLGDFIENRLIKASSKSINELLPKVKEIKSKDEYLDKLIKEYETLKISYEIENNKLNRLDVLSEEYKSQKSLVMSLKSEVEAKIKEYNKELGIIEGLCIEANAIITSIVSLNGSSLIVEVPSIEFTLLSLEDLESNQTLLEPDMNALIEELKAGTYESYKEYCEENSLEVLKEEEYTLLKGEISKYFGETKETINTDYISNGRAYYEAILKGIENYKNEAVVLTGEEAKNWLILNGQITSNDIPMSLKNGLIGQENNGFGSETYQDALSLYLEKSPLEVYTDQVVYNSNVGNARLDEKGNLVVEITNGMYYAMYEELKSVSKSTYFSSGKVETPLDKILSSLFEREEFKLVKESLEQSDLIIEEAKNNIYSIDRYEASKAFTDLTVGNTDFEELSSKDECIEDLIKKAETNLGNSDSNAQLSKNLFELILLKNLSAEERKIYAYWYNKGDSEKIKEYEKVLEDKVNQIIGTERAKQSIDILLSSESLSSGYDKLAQLGYTSLLGTSNGLSKWVEDVRNTFSADGIRSALYYEQAVLGSALTQNIDINALTESLKTGEISQSDYETKIKMSKLCSDFSKWTGNIFGLDNVYGFTNSVGYMIPSILISRGVGSVLPSGMLLKTKELITSLSGTGIGIGLPSFGSKLEESYENGIYGASAYGYAAANALMQAGTEAVFGGIDGLSIFKSKNWIVDLLKEGTTETIQQWAEIGMSDIHYSEQTSFEEYMRQGKESFIQGMLMAAVMNGGGKAINIGSTTLSIKAEDIMNFRDINGTINYSKAMDYILGKSYEAEGEYAKAIEYFDKIGNKKEIMNILLKQNYEGQANQILLELENGPLKENLSKILNLFNIMGSPISLKGELDPGLSSLTPSLLKLVSSLSQEQVGSFVASLNDKNQAYFDYKTMLGEKTETIAEEVLRELISDNNNLASLGKKQLDLKQRILIGFNDINENQLRRSLVSYLDYQYQKGFINSRAVAEKLSLIGIKPLLYGNLAVNSEPLKRILEKMSLDKKASSSESCDILMDVYKDHLSAIKGSEEAKERYNYFSSFEVNGVDQSIFKKIVFDEQTLSKYNSIIDAYFPKMEISERYKLLETVDKSGACSYAAICNVVLDFARKKLSLAEFKKKFGYDLYYEENGKRYFNGDKLLLDFYCFANKDVKDGIVRPNFLKPGYTVRSMDIESQFHFVHNSDYRVIKEFLKSKGMINNFNFKTLINHFNPKSSDFMVVPEERYLEYGVDEIKRKILKGINAKEFMIMRIFQGRGRTKETLARYHFYDGTPSWDVSKLDSGHDAYILGIDENSGNIALFSWGRFISVKLEELKNCSFEIKTITMD